ncbi:ABC-type cobalamin/Fe3+-siderophores transport system ATPase subunit [Winogradskyella pacifica]|uniref:ABC-type cobalamin/Fe3+-siderophores transport system ATPase subunit n=1 Tax=Winogradskyella pacifica TaxID=664642 RepID=A0A3D9N365_9FLAO|nr:ABC transporter ATP-binding protein [Winogradskyella pacifica]REE27238.1 ABC-type cobalamin/Fe3+-siderophores transport system ATPase subunit [Winogradskyella pacifica]
MIFELDNVELYFKNKRILNGIYLKAETGEVTAILGRNGCGKSCLLNIAFGNLKPKYMLVRLDSKPLLKPLYSTGIAIYLPQYNFIPGDMTLSFVFKLYAIDWAIFIESFEAFSIYKNARFNALSGGERRIIETYIILKTKSQIVFLDEPFSHLSPLHIETVKQLIQEEKKEKAIIISDHMYQHIIEASDHIYLLNNGSTKKIENLTELEDYKYLSEGTL